MKCPKCHFKVSKKDRYCPYCGESLHEETIEATIVNERYENIFNNEYDKLDIEKNKVFALFSYLGILFIIPLIACPDSKYAKFHVNQGIILLIVNVILSIATKLLMFVPFIYLPLEGIIQVVLLALTIYGVYNAATGKAKELPIIGKYKVFK